MYWSVTQLPELEGYSRTEVNEIWRAANFKSMKHFKHWLAFLPAGLCGGIGSVLGGIVGAMIGGGIGGFISLPFAIEVIRPHVGAVIEERKLNSD